MAIPATYHAARRWGYSRPQALILALRLGRRLRRHDPPCDIWGRRVPAGRAAHTRSASVPD